MAKLDPAEVAFWRYEQIQEALGEDLHPSVRGPILRQISKAPVRWPNGITKRISLATLYRWLEHYREGELEALQPRQRCDKGKPRQQLSDEVVDEALRLMDEDDGVTYTFMLAVLRADFPQHTITRSTLQRRLAARPEYARIKRARKRSRRRGRFVAKEPHDIWHIDAKGPVTVRLSCGDEQVFHIISVLDDATRAVLAALVVPSPDLSAAVRVFRMAALRWGLPNRLYADRASIFDSVPFRRALAQLGSHRIETKARNAEAHGKIEAYHRTLVLWYVDRLGSQVVVDLQHLQQLLDGVIAKLYQPHRHRGLKCPPEQALGGRVSARSVPPARLYEAFRQKRQLKAHRKTGEVDIAGATYLVPDELRGRRLTFLVDPPGEVPPMVIDPESGKERELRRAAIRPEDIEAPEDGTTTERWGPGALQTLYDSWRGRRRPQAEPGFGLPEIYALLGRAAGHHVPRSDAEADLIQRVYRDIGPFSRAATEAAMQTIESDLGPGRPIKSYLDALQRLATRADAQDDEEP
jgi:transposase InsO family protein